MWGVSQLRVGAGTTPRCESWVEGRFDQTSQPLSPLNPHGLCFIPYPFAEWGMDS